MTDQLAGRSERIDLLLPADRSDLLSALHRHGQVLATEYEPEGIRVRAVVPLKLLAQFDLFRQPETVPMVTGPVDGGIPLLTGV